MKIVIYSVGRKSKQDYLETIKNYSNRLSNTHNLSWEFLAPSSCNGAKARKLESDAIRARLKPNDIVWLLDETGQQISSLQLSTKINTLQNTGISRLAIVIGGAYGVDADLLKQASWVWSLSKLVFPHQMVRLILIEQLYRADQIQKGTAYHHA